MNFSSQNACFERWNPASVRVGLAHAGGNPSGGRVPPSSTAWRSPVSAQQEYPSVVFCEKLGLVCLKYRLVLPREQISFWFYP